MALSEAAQIVSSHLLEKEGVGDTITSVETGAKGLTTALADKIRREHGTELTDDQVIEKYLEQLEGEVLSAWGGEGEMDKYALAAFIDLGYNLGEGIFSESKSPSMMKALKEGDQEEALKQTLDTVKVTDKDGNRGTMKGLAKRRADNYNAAAASIGLTQIDEVEQEEGRIVYRKGGEEFAQHKGAPVPQSPVGVIKVQASTAEPELKSDQEPKEAMAEFEKDAPLDRGFDSEGDTFGENAPEQPISDLGEEPAKPSLQEEADAALQAEAGRVLGFEEASPGIPLGEQEPISASEEEAEALELILSGVVDQESVYNPLANQRSIYESDDPDVLAADEALFSLSERAGQL